MAKKGQQTKVPSSLFGACLNLLSAYLGGPLRLGGLSGFALLLTPSRRGTQRYAEKNRRVGHDTFSLVGLHPFATL